MIEFCICGIIGNEEKTVNWFLDSAAFLVEFGLRAINWVSTEDASQTQEMVQQRASNYVVPLNLWRSVHPTFVDFETGRNEALEKAQPEYPWILLIDQDECLLRNECTVIQSLLRQPVEAWYLPRRKWLDLKCERQVEEEFYPDWQISWIRNDPSRIRYKGKVHETIVGNSSIAYHKERVLHKHHFEPYWRDLNDIKNKRDLYTKLGGPNAFQRHFSLLGE